MIEPHRLKYLKTKMDYGGRKHDYYEYQETGEIYLQDECHFHPENYGWTEADEKAFNYDEPPKYNQFY
jgi:hypothetical protein